MRNLFLSITTLFMCLNFCDADEPSRIAKVTTSKTKATITGVGDSKLEVVLRLGKTKHTKKLEWTSSAVGPFSAHVVSTDRIPLGNKEKATSDDMDDLTLGDALNLLSMYQKPGIVFTEEIKKDVLAYIETLEIAKTLGKGVISFRH